MRVFEDQFHHTIMLMIGVLAAVSILSSCTEANENGPINIGFIGSEGDLHERGLRLSPIGQHIRGATSEGLVGLDQAGRIVPNLAERWHVSPDGLFYTFKLRNVSWPDEEPISAEEVRRILNGALDQLDGTSLGLDLAKLVEIKAMTGRVIELRLSSPMPEFLRLLAQPELGLVKGGAGLGPMKLELDEAEKLASLVPLPADKRGLSATRGDVDDGRLLTIRALSASAAVDEFSNGNIDLVLNGDLGNLPLAELGPLSRGTIQVDPARGIFGLAFLNSNALLSDPARREALSMAIDRDALIQPFGLAGWQAREVILPESLAAESGGISVRWGDLNLDDRRAIAADRIAQWQSAAGQEPLVRVRLRKAPGNDELFNQIEQSWSAIGVKAIRVTAQGPADLELRDKTARYSSPRWFLNQFNCRLRAGLCSTVADDLVEASLELRDPRAKSRALVDAHAALLADEVFIPFGAPVRWSLVRGTIEAYEPNPWALHPLFPLSQITN